MTSIFLDSSSDTDGINFSSNQNDIIKSSTNSSTNNTINTSEEEYKLLLETISNLQSELERTKNENKSLTNQNQTLQKEQATLNTNISTVQSRFDETKKSLVKLMENSHSSSLSNSICKREKEFKLIESKWRNLVDKERKELEEQRNEYMNQVKQVESIRIQIRIEMRKECEEYIQLLSKEKDEWEEKYHTIKRNHDLMEVQSKVSIDTMAKEIEMVQKARDEEVTKLQEALTNHMEGTADSTSQLDQLRMDVAESNTSIEKMTLIERELRKSLEIALSERKNEEILKNEAISSYEMELTKIRSNISTNEAQTQALQNEVECLKKTLDTVNASLRQKSNQFTDERVKTSSLTSHLRQKEEELHRMKDDLKDEHQRSSAKLQSELRVLKQHNASLLSQKQRIEGQLLEVRAKLKQVKTESVVKEETMRREMESNALKIVLENSKLHGETSELVSELKQKEIDYKNESEKNILSNEIHKHAINLERRENDAMVKKYEILEVNMDEIKRKYEETQEELNLVYRDMEAQHKKLDISEEKLSDKETEISVLNAKLDKMSNDQREGETKSLNEMEQIQAEMTIMKSKLEKERRETRDLLKEQEKNFKSKINKEKRKAECYKEKAIEAHTKKLQVKHLLLQQQEEQNQKSYLQFP